ncbi:hypothetical protein [Trinickia acidisoli]|uniref:hypothetical protein n=1 Tax=Trinickia acidisoli TaxID=2767482 RepID=UPI001A90C248|nr:hypothetical protein [Trinickia acidisoli]
MYLNDVGRPAISLQSFMLPPSAPAPLPPLAAKSATAASAASSNDSTEQLMAFSRRDPGEAARTTADNKGKEARDAADAKGQEARDAADAKAKEARDAADAQGTKARETGDHKSGLDKFLPNQNPFTAITHNGNVLPLVEDTAIAAGAVAVVAALAPIEIPAGIATAVLGGLAAIF